MSADLAELLNRTLTELGVPGGLSPRPSVLRAALADAARGDLGAERQALVAAYEAGIVEALRRPDFTVSGWLARLGRSAAAEAAINAWITFLGMSDPWSGSRWSSSAPIAAEADVVVLVAGRRYDDRKPDLALACYRDGTLISAASGTSEEARVIRFAEQVSRLANVVIVGSDLPRLAGELPGGLALLQMADLHETADWLRRQGLLEIDGELGLSELAKATLSPTDELLLVAPGNDLDLRLAAVVRIWFHLLRPRVLDRLASPVGLAQLVSAGR